MAGEEDHTEGLSDVGLGKETGDVGDPLAGLTTEAATEGEGKATPPSEETGTSADALTFYDASKVPTELQATFREMKTAFTKKTQSLSQDRKALEDRERRLSNDQNQAEIFRDLMGNAPVREYIMKLAKGESSTSEGEGSGDLGIDPELHTIIQKEIKPFKDQILQLQGQLSSQRTLAEFERAHPDWEQYREGMETVLKRDLEDVNRGVRDRMRSPEDAYNAAFAMAAKERIEAHRKTKERERAAAEKPGAAPRTVKKSSGLVSSIREAAKKAADEMGIEYGDM